MRIAISGSSGMIGSAFVDAFMNQGHTVFRLVRSRGVLPGNEIPWDPVRGVVDLDALEGMDAVLHLAGENIAAKRWNPEQKQRLRESRVRGTEVLANALNQLRRPPHAFVCASAIGYYGDCGDQAVDESGPQGAGFLAELCRDWERAAQAVSSPEIRVVHLRLGMVLSSGGGALARLLPVFRWGLGGRLGNGRMYMSWVSLSDVLGAVQHCLANPSLHGPINITSPCPVTNLKFTRTLSGVVHRPALFPVPAWGIRLLFGEMGEALFLSGSRIMPARLLESGFVFRHTHLREALEHCVAAGRGEAGISTST